MVAYTAGFMTHDTCRLTAKNRDQLRNTKLDNRVWATFTFLCLGGQCPQGGANVGSCFTSILRPVAISLAQSLAVYAARLRGSPEKS